MNSCTNTIAKMEHEIIGWWYDHTYVRRGGVLYDEFFAFGDISSVKISESDIPRDATICTPPIRYSV